MLLWMTNDFAHYNLVIMLDYRLFKVGQGGMTSTCRSHVICAQLRITLVFLSMQVFKVDWSSFDCKKCWQRRASIATLATFAPKSDYSSARTKLSCFSPTSQPALAGQH